MKRRILIVEDDAIIAKVYGTKYSTSGFETRTAEDGEAGLRLLATFKPDLVHLDLGIPKVNGAEIIAHIRRHPETSSLPVVVLSNTYQNHLVKAALHAGASECVSKATCTPKMMVELVEKHLARADADALRLRAASASPATGDVALLAEAPGPETAASSPSEGSPAPASSVTTETARHAAFQAEIHSAFVERAPEMLATVRDRIEPLLRAETEEARVQALFELSRATESFARHSGLAGVEDLAQLSCALAALLRELTERPAEITPSALRTIVDAGEFLDALSSRAVDPDPTPPRPHMVLVVDDDAICRRAVCLALARLNVSTLSVDDPALALRLLAENRFSMIFLDVEMPGMNGFELCRQLRTLPANKRTPVVFVTTLSGSESREQSHAYGGNDIMAKPFLPMELAVKALSLLRQSESGPPL